MTQSFNTSSPENLRRIVACQCHTGTKLLTDRLDDLLLDGNDMAVSFTFILSGGVHVVFTATLDCIRPDEDCD